MILSKRKTIVLILAIVVSVAILLSGTFAWQSISQVALNEISASVNPGGRLHDDFVDITFGEDGEADYDTMTYNKDVYVENFTSLNTNGVQVFARVRLDEYMEFGEHAGELSDANNSTSLVAGAYLSDKSTWSTHIPGITDPFHKYWNWDFAGKTTYMPTFNKNKDSLQADVNGTFANRFTDYVSYTVGDTENRLSIYDADGNIDDEVGVVSGSDLAAFEYSGNITTKNETHTAKETLDSKVITMTEYMALLNDNDKNNDTGNFWVWDEVDGWAYWAAPINPDTATGLLLDSISRTKEIINENWYYGINVVAQFITADDIGLENGTGFYDPSGAPPSNNALLLLNEIGVDVSFEVDTLAELQTALAYGGNIVLNNDITVDSSLIITEDTVLDLNSYTISNEVDIRNTDASEQVWSLISAHGQNTRLTIKGGNIDALQNDCYCIDVRDGATVIIENGAFSGNVSVAYVEKGTLTINGGTFSLKQLYQDGNPYGLLLNMNDESCSNGESKICICSGGFTGFDPSGSSDGNLVCDGYTVVCDGATPSVYNVIKM